MGMAVSVKVYLKKKLRQSAKFDSLTISLHIPALKDQMSVDDSSYGDIYIFILHLGSC